MKSKNIKLISLLLTTMTLSGLMGCGSKKLSKTDAYNKVIDFNVSTNPDINDMKNIMTTSIKSYDYNANDKDSMISAYITQMYASVTNLNNKLNILGYEVEDVVKKYNVDVNNSKTFKKIPDCYATTKGFLEEINSKGFTLKKNSNSKIYSITLNAQDIYDKYNQYAGDSLKQFMKLSAYEQQNSSKLDLSKNNVDIAEIAKRIDMIQKGIKSDTASNYKHIGEWMSSANYYYGLLFGLDDNSYLIDNNSKFTDNTLNNYATIAAKYKGTPLGDITSAVLTLVKSEDNKYSEKIIDGIENLIIRNVYTAQIKGKLNISSDEQIKTYLHADASGQAQLNKEQNKKTTK